ncbi:unnamed protein product [Gordionus sp. m RMFG-2023]
MELAVKLCFGVVLVLFNSNRLVNADDSYCLCSKPKDCKGDLILDECGCCHVCSKVKGEVCWGPYDNYENHLLAKGICTPDYPRTPDIKSY